MATGGAMFAQKIPPKTENYSKAEMYFTQTITGIKKLFEIKINEISKTLSRAVNITILTALCLNGTH